MVRGGGSLWRRRLCSIESQEIGQDRQICAFPEMWGTILEVFLMNMNYLILVYIC